MKYKCPCCGFYTFQSEPGATADICKVCFWEDDRIQSEEEDYAGGANGVSLAEARENFRQYGACEKRFLRYARKAGKFDRVCADISEFIGVYDGITYEGMSLEGHLTAVVGGYMVRGSAKGFQFLYDIALGEQEVIAAISEESGVAFVQRRYYEKVFRDTEAYGLHYAVLEDLFEENLMCRSPEELPERYQGIRWIDDDFLEDETMEFDQEAFKLIDSGVEYLNSMHFSIYAFAQRVNA